MTDTYKLWSTLFLIKDFLIEHNLDGFTSFDLVDNTNQSYGDSFRFPVLSAEEVMYFLKFYDLSEGVTEDTINKLHKEKGFNSFDKVNLLLVV